MSQSGTVFSGPWLLLRRQTLRGGQSTCQLLLQWCIASYELQISSMFLIAGQCEKS